MLGLLSLNATLTAYRFISNITEIENTGSLPLVNGVPYLTIRTPDPVLTFHFAKLIASWVDVALDFQVHLEQLTPTSISFFVFDPALSYSPAQLAMGLSLETWLDEIDNYPAIEQPAQKAQVRPSEVLPSQAYDHYGFIWERPGDFVSTMKSGKWCIIRDADAVDAVWLRVRDAVRDGIFPCALVSTPAQAAHYGGTYVICVFTPDWEDKTNVDAARELLHSYGVTENIGYKRDIDTVNNVYGTDAEWTYRA